VPERSHGPDGAIFCKTGVIAGQRFSYSCNANFVYFCEKNIGKCKFYCLQCKAMQKALKHVVCVVFAVLALYNDLQVPISANLVGVATFDHVAMMAPHHSIRHS